MTKSEVQPLVSVLVPAFNAAPFVRAAVSSVMEQSYQNFELLIVDDGSTDETYECLLALPYDSRIRLIHNTANVGQVVARNQLLRSFVGEYACFLDADDIMVPTRIEEQLAVLQADAEIVACVCNLVRLYPDGEMVRMPWLGQETGSQILDVRVHPLTSATSCVFFHRKAVDIAGEFHLYFNRFVGEDTYWLFLLAERGCVYYLNRDLYHYRFNPTSLTVGSVNLRRFSIVDTLNKLKLQRLKTGTDWLESHQIEKLQAYEEDLIRSPSWRCEKWRVLAALRFDHGDWKRGFKCLGQATFTFSFRPTVALIKTWLYGFRTLVAQIGVKND